MANYVRNRVEIIGTEEQVKEVLMFIKGDEVAIDFNKIIPCPEALKVESTHKGKDGMIYLVKTHGGFLGTCMDDYQSSEHYKMMETLRTEDPKCFEEAIKLGKIYLHNIADYEFPSWYEWTWKNWGTYGNAEYIEQFDNIVEFDTITSTPFNVIERLAQIFPNVEFNYIYVGDDIEAFGIEHKYCNGKLAHKKCPEWGSKEGYELMLKVRPYLEDYFEFVDGKYLYKEEV